MTALRTLHKASQAPSSGLLRPADDRVGEQIRALYADLDELERTANLLHVMLQRQSPTPPRY